MNQRQESVTKEATGLYLVKKPVQRAQVLEGLREGSTGRIVESRMAESRAVGNPSTGMRLERVWAVAAADVPPAVAPVVKPAVELAFYRKYTEALLRRYLRLSMQAGRVPSLLSREMFRGNVTHYKVRGFEEVVIFCHDVEQRLARLNETEQQLLKRVVLQEYTQIEAASMMGMSLTCLKQRYGHAVDHLTKLLLEAELLNPLG